MTKYRLQFLANTAGITGAILFVIMITRMVVLDKVNNTGLDYKTVVILLASMSLLCVGSALNYHAESRDD